MFGKSVLSYYANYLKYTVIVAVDGVACWAVLRLIPITSWLGFAAGCVAVGAVYCAAFCLLSFKTNGFGVLRGFARHALKR